MRAIDANALVQKFKAIHEAENQIYGQASWNFTAQCIQTVEDAPTVVQEQQWISFAERRPWEGQQILACSEDGVMWITVFRSCIGFSGAWLPLPEPYKVEP